ncbi:MAG: type II secretion system minor pseudopilin GspI [Gammaproteobacteria bacterium]|nr:type II secretion system minor pseudopilin GspI [Gammaproteobacteria bacterium]
MRLFNYSSDKSRNIYVSSIHMNAAPVQKGFTLIEIIIALMVISVALGAVIATTSNSIKHGAHIKDKTIALWVAQNAIADISIRKDWLSTGMKTQDVTMSGRQWFIKNNVTQTPDKNMRKMDVSIYTDQSAENKVLSLIAYIVKPKSFQKQ